MLFRLFQFPFGSDLLKPVKSKFSKRCPNNSSADFSKVFI